MTLVVAMVAPSTIHLPYAFHVRIPVAAGVGHGVVPRVGQPNALVVRADIELLRWRTHLRPRRLPAPGNGGSPQRNRRFDAPLCRVTIIIAHGDGESAFIGGADSNKVHSRGECPLPTGIREKLTVLLRHGLKQIKHELAGIFVVKRFRDR